MEGIIAGCFVIAVFSIFYLFWAFYMMTCRTGDWVKLMEGDKDRRQHVQEMEKARFAAQQSARQRRSNAGAGAIKLGFGVARRFMR